MHALKCRMPLPPAMLIPPTLTHQFKEKQQRQLRNHSIVRLLLSRRPCQSSRLALRANFKCPLRQLKQILAWASCSLSDLGYKLLLGLLPSRTTPCMFCCAPLIGSHGPSTYILPHSTAPLLSVLCRPLSPGPPSQEGSPHVSRPLPAARGNPASNPNSKAAPSPNTNNTPA